jgi:drug/metabolite transporter (DMT)-like permease
MRGPNLNLMTTVGLWALNFTAIKLAYQGGIPAEALAVSRTILVGLFFATLILLRKESLKFADKKHGWRITLQGALSLGLYMVLFLEGLKTAAVADAAIIMAVSPLLTSVLSVFSKQEKWNRNLLIGALVAFAGVITVVAHHGIGTGNMMGNLLILIAAVVWAVSVIVMRPLLETTSPFVLVTQSLPGALIFLVPYGLKSMISTDWTSLSLTTWLWLGYIAVLSGGVAFVTYYKGVQQLGASRAALYQYLIPPVAAVIGFFVWKDAFFVQQAIGFALVLLGIWLGNRGQA